MGSPVAHWQIISKDPAATARFYGRLFDWRIESANALGYREVKTGSAPGVDGGIWPCPPEAQGLVQLFMQVSDVEACVQQAIALGAKVIVPTAVLPEGDTMAVLLDPTGLAFGLCRRRDAA